jgi:DivIVA domain-containing protein
MRLTAADVKNVAFRRPPLGLRGYSEEEVDLFLRRVGAALDGAPGAQLTVDEVRNVAFRRGPMGRGGYHEDEVDAFLDLVAQELRLRAAEGGVPRPPRPGVHPSTPGAELVRTLWRRAQERDWDGVAALLSPDFTVEWPGTQERFTGRDAWLAVNRSHSEGWQLSIDTVIGSGDEVASRVFVQSGQGVWHTLSFWRLRGGVVTYLTEYYVSEWGVRPQ